jgi:hypothetical protein
MYTEYFLIFGDFYMLIDGLNLVEGSQNTNLVVTNVTLAQRAALTNVNTGELVFVTDGSAPGLYSWNGTTWVPTKDVVDFSNYYTIAQVDTALATKATPAEVTTAIQAVVGAAPAALDTLQEIATQLAANETAATALTNVVSTKAPLASPTFTGTVSDADGKLRAVPQSNKTSAYTLVAADNGKNINITTGGITIPNSVFQAGDIVSVYNQSGSAQNVAWSGPTVYAAGTSAAKSSPLSLSARGVLTIMFVTASEVVVSGNI